MEGDGGRSEMWVEGMSKEKEGSGENKFNLHTLSMRRSGGRGGVDCPPPPPNTALLYIIPNVVHVLCCVVHTVQCFTSLTGNPYFTCHTCTTGRVYVFYSQIFIQHRSRPVNYRHQRKRKSASSSRSVSSGSTRSRSGSSSYSSSKTSSRSRSRSSSSSSRSSYYSRSSSYSGSSRSSSTKSEQVTTRRIIGIKRSAAHRDFDTVPHSYSDRSLDNSRSRKKMKYSHDISSPQKKDQSRARDHMQLRNPRPRDYIPNSRNQILVRDREERKRSRTDDYGMRQVYYPKPRTSPLDNFYPPPPKRHTSDRYTYESRPAHYSPPPYSPPHSPPTRPRMNISHERPLRRDRDSSFDKSRYSRGKPSYIESISPPPHRRRDVTFPSYRDDRQSSSEKQRRRVVPDREPRCHSESKRRNLDKSVELRNNREDTHNYKDKYIILEDSANSGVEKRRPTSDSEDKRKKSATNKQSRNIQKSNMKNGDSPAVAKTSVVTERKKE